MRRTIYRPLYFIGVNSDIVDRLTKMEEYVDTFYGDNIVVSVPVTNGFLEFSYAHRPYGIFYYNSRIIRVCIMCGIIVTDVKTLDDLPNPTRDLSSSTYDLCSNNSSYVSTWASDDDELNKLDSVIGTFIRECVFADEFNIIKESDSNNWHNYAQKGIYEIKFT